MIDFDSDDPVTVTEMRKFQVCVVADLKNLATKLRVLGLINICLCAIMALEFILIVRGK